MAAGTLFAALVVWLLTYAIHSTMLLGGVWILARRPWVTHSLRDTLWKAALTGGLVTATIAVLLPGGARSLTGNIPLPLPIPGPAVSAFHAPLGAAGGSVSWPLCVVALWAVGAFLGVVHLGAGQRRFVRSLGPRRPVMGPAAARLRELRLAAGIGAPVRLTTAPHIEGPAALSSLEICLPERALRDLDQGEQESALAHELGHIARGDVGWRLTALLLERIFFFQPLHRVARRGLSEAAEFLADDWAVVRTQEGMPLARCLAAVAEWLQDGARPVLAAEMATRDSSLLRRVERLVGDRTGLRETPRLRRVAAAVAALALVSLLAPGVAPRRAPTAPLPPEAPLFVPAAYVVPLPSDPETLEALGWRIRVVLPRMERRLTPPEREQLHRALERLDAEIRTLGTVAAPAPPALRIVDGRRVAPAPRARQVVRLRHGYVAWS